MPWKGSSVMDERVRSVARLLEGEPMDVLCREFGISRKTSYKICDLWGLELSNATAASWQAGSPDSCHEGLG